MTTIPNLNSNVADSILKRYTVHYSQGSRKYVCKLCPEGAVSSKGIVDTQGFYLYPGSVRFPDYLVYFETMYHHLVTDHGMKSCEHCGSLMSARGMKKHQRSVECMQARRQHEMNNKGYDRIDLGRVSRFLEQKLDELTDSIHWQDYESLKSVTDTKTEVYNNLTSMLGVIAVKSKLIDRRWHFEDWAPTAVCHYLSLLGTKGGLTSEEYMSNLFDFANANEDVRECIIGGLELELSQD